MQEQGPCAEGPCSQWARPWDLGKQSKGWETRENKTISTMWKQGKRENAIFLPVSSPPRPAFFVQHQLTFLAAIDWKVEGLWQEEKASLTAKTGKQTTGRESKHERPSAIVSYPCLPICMSVAVFASCCFGLNHPLSLAHSPRLVLAVQGSWAEDDADASPSTEVPTTKHSTWLGTAQQKENRRQAL